MIGIVGGSLMAIGGEPSGVVVLLLVPLTIWHCRDRDWRKAPRWALWWCPAVIAGALICGGVAWYGGLRSVMNADTDLEMASVYALTWQDWLLAQGGAVWYWLLATLWPALLTPDLDVDRLSPVVRAVHPGRDRLTRVAVPRHPSSPDAGVRWIRFRTAPATHRADPKKLFECGAVRGGVYVDRHCRRLRHAAMESVSDTHTRSVRWPRNVR